MEGIRVVDITTALSGPFCTWLLGSLGADVIKVEPPQGDSARAAPPFRSDISLYFASVNRNKRSIILDLKTEEGKEALHRLMKSADVLVENMRPGVRDRLGFSDQDLNVINPRLIVAHISGFGQSGPLSHEPAYDIVVQAMSGVMSINGPMGGPPTRVGFSAGDIVASLFTALGIMQRLYERDALRCSGLDHVDVSMLACQWACLENAFARYLNAGIVPEPIGSRHPSLTPFETYPSQDVDFVIALSGSWDWPKFCQTIGRSDLVADVRFADDENRLENRDALDDILGAHFKARPASYWLKVLKSASIPCALIENIESIATSPLADAYNAFSKVETSDGEIMRFVRNPIARLGSTETPAPQLGEHTAEILKELGL